MQRPILVVQTPIISGEDLKKLLHVDHKILGHNFQLALDHGRAMTSTRQQRATWLMQEPAFQQWFRAMGSHILIVDGMEQEMDTISSLSYFCAMLHNNLSSLQVAIPLTFFCGLHAKPGENLEGAQGIMRSLIYQLLLLHLDFDYSFRDYPFLEGIRNQSIVHLCRLFRNLLTSFQSATVFCMIDGISEYEISSRLYDVNIMMGYFKDLVDETNREDSGINFKFLVTSSMACRLARVWFPFGRHLVMPDDAGLDGPIEFNIASESRLLTDLEYINDFTPH